MLREDEQARDSIPASFALLCSTDRYRRSEVKLLRRRGDIQLHLQMQLPCGVIQALRLSDDVDQPLVAGVRATHPDEVQLQRRLRRGGGGRR
jgi:hypothetical protein